MPVAITAIPDTSIAPPTASITAPGGRKLFTVVGSSRSGASGRETNTAPAAAAATPTDASTVPVSTNVLHRDCGAKHAPLSLSDGPPEPDDG